MSHCSGAAFQNISAHVQTGAEMEILEDFSIKKKCKPLFMHA